MPKRIHIVKTATEVQPAFMGLKDLASWSGIGVTRLREAVKSGDLPSYKYGGTFLVSLEEFNQWMEKHRFKPDLETILDHVMEGLK